MRLSRLVTGAAMLGLALVSACGPGGASSTSSTVQQAKDQKLTYLYFSDGKPDEQATRDAIADFEKQTGAIVDLQIIPFANLYTQLQAELAANTAPDVARVTSIATIQGDVLNLAKLEGPSFVGQYLDGETGTVEGKNHELLAVPSDLTINGPLINLDLFQAAGVQPPDPAKPWSWSDMMAAATAVQKATHTEYAVAMDVSGHRFSTMLSEYGTSYFNADGTAVAMDKVKATAAVQQFLDLNRSGAMPKDLWLAAGSKYKAANEIFLAKQVPVYISGNWQVSAFAQTATFRWAAAPNPCEARCGGFPGGKFMVAFKQSPHQKLAADFIAFMNSRTEQEKIDKGASWLPTRKDLIKSGVSYPIRGQDMTVFTKEISRTPSDTYATAFSTAFTPTANAMVKELAKALAGQEDAGQVVDNVRATAQSSLKGGS